LRAQYYHDYLLSNRAADGGLVRRAARRQAAPHPSDSICCLASLAATASGGLRRPPRFASIGQPTPARELEQLVVAGSRRGSRGALVPRHQVCVIGQAAEHFEEVQIPDGGRSTGNVSMHHRSRAGEDKQSRRGVQRRGRQERRPHCLGAHLDKFHELAVYHIAGARLAEFRNRQSFG